MDEWLGVSSFDPDAPWCDDVGMHPTNGVDHCNYVARVGTDHAALGDVVVYLAVLVLVCLALRRWLVRGWVAWLASWGVLFVFGVLVTATGKAGGWLLSAPGGVGAVFCLAGWLRAALSPVDASPATIDASQAGENGAGEPR